MLNWLQGASLFSKISGILYSYLLCWVQFLNRVDSRIPSGTPYFCTIKGNQIKHNEFSNTSAQLWNVQRESEASVIKIPLRECVWASLKRETTGGTKDSCKRLFPHCLTSHRSSPLDCLERTVSLARTVAEASGHNEQILSLTVPKCLQVLPHPLANPALANILVRLYAMCVHACSCCSSTQNTFLFLS